MQVQVLREGEREFTVEVTGEDYSLGEIIHHELLDEKNVTFAGVLPPHPADQEAGGQGAGSEDKAGEGVPEQSGEGPEQHPRAAGSREQGVHRWSGMKFCPKCGTRLKLKQVKLDKGSVMTYVCDNCGFSDKAGKTVTQTTEEELARRSGHKGRRGEGRQAHLAPDHEDRVPQVRTWRGHVVVPADPERG